MANRTRFAGMFNAADYAYGCAGISLPDALIVDAAAPAGTTTLTLAFGQTTLSDGTVLFPLSILAPINVGSGANSEQVTPTAVGNPTLPGYDLSTITAVFANAHGRGDPVSSATIGLQEAINDANARGGGVVFVTPVWASLGGTAAMLAAAVLPSNGSVLIQDNRGLGMQFWQAKATGAAISAPAIATTSTVASLAATGTWAASTTHVRFTYVTATGGETLAGSDYTFTPTLNKAIGGTGPAAATGAVGYRVYIGTTAWLAPVIAANGTVIQCGAIAAFQIGTSFSIATLTATGAALVPVVSSAWATSLQPTFEVLPPFQTISPPTTDVGTISAATATPLADVNLPLGFLNYLGRVVRLTGTAVITTNSATGTLTINLLLYSVYGVTSITPFTVACPSTAMGAAVVNCEFEILMNTTAVGATGTVECHGFVHFSLAGTAVGTLAMDFIHAASSTVDLTKQNTLEISITTATVVPTAGLVRQLVVEVLQ